MTETTPTARPWTDADRQAVGNALHDFLTGLGLPPEMVRPYGAADAVLDALAELLRAGQEVALDDLRATLRALGLGDHARSCPPHEVVVREVLPAIERLRGELAEMTADRDGRQQLVEAQGRVQLGHEATIRELRARVAELEQQLRSAENQLLRTWHVEPAPGRWELPDGITWDLIRWHCTRCEKTGTWTGTADDPPGQAAAEARQHAADHELWAAARLSAPPPETAGGDQ